MSELQPPNSVSYCEHGPTERDTSTLHSSPVLITDSSKHEYETWRTLILFCFILMFGPNQFIVQMFAVAFSDETPAQLQIICGCDVCKEGRERRYRRCK